ncbi:MAG: quinolinate synthase NadA, partial [Clostridia bacterium]|nr:quinolinate synthase NadA [Clostridia bacterium]
MTKEEKIALILKLKQEKNAVILAHYYVADELQAIADYTGDSFYLSQRAADCTADIIVFCGVRFLGESAKILAPDKTVYLPAPTADCPMAHMASVEGIQKMRSEVEDLAVVCYVNSTAELKAYSDVCVTSSNALKIVRGLKE